MKKRVRFFESIKKTFSQFQKKFNSLSHVEKRRVQFFESCEKNQFWVFKKLKSFIFDFFNRKFQFLSRIQKNGIDSLSRIQKKSSILWVIRKKKFNSYWEEVHERGSIQWVIYKEFNSLSHCWNKQKRVQFFESFFGMWLFFKKIFQFWTHIKKGSILWVKWLKKSSILWVQCKKDSTLSVKFKKVFNTLSHFLWKIQLFESYWSKKEFNSSHVKK